MTYEPESTSVSTVTLTYQWVPPLPTLTPTLVPTETKVVTDNIPEPTYYDCRAIANGYCILPDTDPIDAIAMTVFGEGGATNLQLAVDMIQVLDNVMYNTWECWQYERCSDEAKDINPQHRSYLDTTKDERVRLALYSMSRPYTVGAPSIKYPPRQIPAWNAWEKSFPLGALSNLPYSRKLYEAVWATVEKWLASPDLNIIAYWVNPEGKESFFTPAPILISDTNIIYFYGGPGAYNADLASTASYIYPFKIGTRQAYIYYSTQGHAP
jgi:hypothetical protein